jgi:hypothetical protein
MFTEHEWRILKYISGFLLILFVFILALIMYLYRHDIQAGHGPRNINHSTQTTQSTQYPRSTQSYPQTYPSGQASGQSTTQDVQPEPVGPEYVDPVDTTTDGDIYNKDDTERKF